MSLWQRLWHRRSGAALERLRVVKLSLAGWAEDEPVGGMRLWRSAEGDALTLTSYSRRLPAADDVVELQRWARRLVADRGAGLIEVHAATGCLGRAVTLIDKRLEMPAYVFTGMLLLPDSAGGLIWTAVSVERGTTGMREAVVTADLFQAGRLTIEDYERSWAQDPYDPSYRGADTRVLRFMSDDECYDERFPLHPLSTVRRVLKAIPSAVRIGQS